MDITALFAKLHESPIYHSEIITKALALKGIPADSALLDYPLLREYHLDSEHLRVLARHNIRASETRDQLILTDDDVKEPEINGEPFLNAWVFKRHSDPKDDDFRITLYLKLYIDSMDEKGVTIVPISCGQEEQGICQASNRKMFDILVGNDPNPPAYAVQFTGLTRASHLSWQNLGHENLKSVFTLFRIVTKGNQFLAELATKGVLSPTSEKNDGRGLPYHGNDTQTMLIAHWREQLEVYKSKLVI